MLFETTLIYSKPILHQALFSFWWRTVGFWFLLALGLMTIVFVFLVAQGDMSWRVGALGVVIFFGYVIPAGFYIIHYRNLMEKLSALGSPRAIFRVDESSFTFESEPGVSTLQWAAVKELWKFKNVWLLLFSRSNYSTLPLDCMSSEMQSFIVLRIQENGGRVD